MLHDIRFAVRSWLRTPGVAILAVAALALGIGANTALFSVVHAVMLQRLPFADPDRIVAVWEHNEARPGRMNTVAPANFLRWKDRQAAFDSLSAVVDYRASLAGSGEPEELVVLAVTYDIFRTLGVAPLYGRAFTANEDPDRDMVILGYDLWQRRFGGDPRVVGRAIQLAGAAATVVGVMPPDVRLFMKSGSLVGKPADIWVPLQFPESARQPRGRYISAVGRLKAGVSVQQAQAQMDAIAAGAAADWPAFDKGWTVKLVPLRDELAGELRAALVMLSGAVALVLLIACANVGNLLLARGASRRRELAVRTALGAGRWRLARQMLTESLVLAAAGGLAGVLLAVWSMDTLVALSPVDLGYVARVGLNYPVMGFAALLCVATAIICGLAPAFATGRHDINDGLKEGAREAGASGRGKRLRQAFVVCEVALSLVLLVGAGLLVRSFANLRGINPGFNAQGVLTARVALPSALYKDPARADQFFRRAIDRISALPGVQAAGAISFLPFAGLGAATDFSIEGRPPAPPGQEPTVDVAVCDNGYFKAMQIPLKAGRIFEPRELEQQSNVVVINEAFARTYFPNQNALGQRLRIVMSDPAIPTTIVGVVGDVHLVNLTTAPRATAYWPPPQLGYNARTFAVRTSGDPLALGPLVQREIQAVDRNQPVSEVRTMEQWVGRSMAQLRFSWTLLAIFSAVALLLASIGIYAVISYTISQQTAEIGLRLALGAVRGDILAMVVGRGMRVAGIGVATGLLLALAATRVLTAFLYQVKAMDPATIVGAGVLLTGIAAAACYVPARRASRIEPVEALRDQ